MYKLGIIGAGKMAGALVKGIIRSKTYNKNEIILSDIDKEKLQNISNEHGVRTTGDNRELADSAEIIILAVKPGHIKELLKEIKNHTSKKKLYISVAAGIKTSFMEKILKKELKIVRIMPNKPVVVQEGAFGIYYNKYTDENDKESVEKIFQPLGKVVTVDDENLIDVVTGLSGSGPAFVAVFAEALADGAVKMGLHRDEALKLSLQTILGSAKLMIETNTHPAKLKDMVSSPGGTTISGIHELENKGFRNAVISTVEATTNKSKELSMEDES